MGKTILDKIKVIPLKIKKQPLGNVMHVLKKKELKKRIEKMEFWRSIFF